MKQSQISQKVSDITKVSNITKSLKYFKNSQISLDSLIYYDTVSVVSTVLVSSFLLSTVTNILNLKHEEFKHLKTFTLQIEIYHILMIPPFA